MKHRFNREAGKQDFHSRITNQIIASLEQGTRPWVQPWNAGNAEGRILRPLRHNAQPYGGINVVMLWLSGQQQGFTSPYWMTYRQAAALGAHVMKGEHGSPVIYASSRPQFEHKANGEDVERSVPFQKLYTVFNAQQIDGLAEHFYDKPPPRLEPVERIDHADEFFAASGADLRVGGNKAFYSMSQDYIRVPPIEFFKDPESYYATIGHEHVHWTRHPDRLARDFGRQKFGDEGYAREELVAELGSAFLCSELDLTPELREDHASYISEWIKILKNDKHAVFRAASHAQKATDFLISAHDPQPALTPEPDSTPDLFAESAPETPAPARSNRPRLGM